MDPALITEVLQHLHSVVPTVGSLVPVENASGMELTNHGFQISFPDGRRVSLSSSVRFPGAIFFTGHLGDPTEHLFDYTVQLHDAKSPEIYRRVVETLLA